jgi:EF-P beta-lysylation protein EpmB
VAEGFVWACFVMNSTVEDRQLPPLSAKEARWQTLLRTAIRDADALLARVGLERALTEKSRAAARQFGVFAPLAYVAKIRPGDPDDPLLRQVLPLDAEMDDAVGYSADPVGDAAAAIAPGVLQKYHGRVLLIATGACAIHCRYCFRRHFPYGDRPRSAGEWQAAIEQIAADPTIEEVILSGGDPLMLVDSVLSELAERFAEIGHLRRLRIHTRLPIVIPERVTSELIGWLRATRLTPIIVVHANHPRELDGPVLAAIGRLVDAGVPVLNQAVLLRGVNDDVHTLADLCLELINSRVLPYYLHQLDRVAGAAHFEVSIERGREIMRQLRARLPGYAVPRYVCEVAGESSKREIV